MTDVRFTQIYRTEIGAEDPDIRFTQAWRTTIGAENPDIRFTQAWRTTIGAENPDIRFTQAWRTVILTVIAAAAVTQVTAEVIADVIAHTPNQRVTQVSVEVIGEPPVIILTPSPLINAFLNSPYSAFIIATGGLGALTYSLTSGSITNATQTNPVVITSAGHGLISGQKILISGVGGMTELNGNYYYVNVLSSSTFSLYTDSALTIPVDGTAFTAYSGGGTWTSALPAGLTLNSATGEISGTPTEAGTFTVNVTVVDNVGNSASATYTVLVDSIEQEAVNLGIGPLGLGYTVQRGFSGIECHVEFVDVGLNTDGNPHTWKRSQAFFPRDSFPDDQKFYLELVGSNIGAIDVTWTIFNDDYSQVITQLPGQAGRIRNAVEFEGPQGIYKISATAVVTLSDASASAIRIIAPVKRGQKLMSEVRLTNANTSSVQDQTIGGPDLFRTASRDWVSSHQPVWRFEAAAWEHITDIMLYITMANASFDPIFRYSEIALVDIDDPGEFGYDRKVSSVGDDVFLNPTFYSISIAPTSLRDGHRYQIYARSVRPDGFFNYNTYLHTAHLQIALDPANSCEVYNRCGSFKRVYMPGRFVPNPEIYFQVETGTVSEADRTLQRLAASTAAASTDASGSGANITQSTVTPVFDESVRSSEISGFLTGGHDYEAGCDLQAEIVYKFTDVLRRPMHNYMF